MHQPQNGPERQPQEWEPGQVVDPSPAPGGDSAGGAAAGRGGTGAPPSNTAPDNCNFQFQALRWGIDSLYLSYPGELSPEAEARLRGLKALAQGSEDVASRAQIQLGVHVFEVRDKGAGLFPYVLTDDAFRLQLSGSRSKSFPMAYVQVSSRLLSHRTPEAIEEELRLVLGALGDVRSATVSRADLFVDFACSVDMESWGREAWVTRAGAVSQYARKGKFTGWSIGDGGALMARLYNKGIECEQSGKTYLLDLWRQVGWQEHLPVWRLEFEFHRDCLRQMQIGEDEGGVALRGLHAILAARSGLWSYATTEWLKLAIPSETDQTRSRWPIHPLWGLLSSVDWESPGGPLLRSYEATRAPSRAWLGQRTLSLLASMASVAGLPSLDAAAAELLLQASQALSNRYALSGLSLDDGFAEMVQANNRRYNVALNPPLVPKPPASAVPLGVDTGAIKLKDGESLNPYERASRGQ